MSSFSSVIRKPGGSVAPKIAPKRNIVRKSANQPVKGSQSQSQSQSQAQTSATPATSVNHVDGRVREPSVILIEDGSQPQPGPLPIEVEVGVVSQQGWDTSNGITLDNTATATPEGHSQPLTAHSPSANRQELVSSVSESISTHHSSEQPSEPFQSQNHSNISSLPIALNSARTGELTTGTTHHPPHASPPLPAPRSSPSNRPKRSRKQAPRASATILLAQPVPSTPPSIEPVESPEELHVPSIIPQRGASVASQRSETEEALDRVNSSLLRVGEIAAQIQSRSGQSSTSNGLAGDLLLQSHPNKRRKVNGDTPQTIQDIAAGIVADAAGHFNEDNVSALSRANGRRSRRHDTPEDPDTQEIDPELTIMGDILDDKFKYGKKSEIEKQMQANWPEILRRRKEDADLRLAIAQSGRRKKKVPTGDQPGTGHQSNAGHEEDDGYGFEQVVENGQIVIVSREIDRQALTARTVAQADDANIRDDDIIYRRVLATTLSSKNQIAPGQQWDDLSTETFYQGLKMFGTDFMMISNMIPGKNRRQVKLKYNVEERTNWSRIQNCLSQKQEVNLAEYAQITGLEMSNVADVYKQMEDDEKRLREEDEARRLEEGIISQDQPLAETADGEADIAVPSIEGQDPDGIPTADDGGVHEGVPDRQSTAAASRVGSTTTGRHTAQPSGKKKQTKKSASAAKRGKQAANRNKGFEGVEERLGDMGDIGIPMI